MPIQNFHGKGGELVIFLPVEYTLVWLKGWKINLEKERLPRSEEEKALNESENIFF